MVFGQGCKRLCKIWIMCIGYVIERNMLCTRSKICVYGHDILYIWCRQACGVVVVVYLPVNSAGRLVL